MARVVIELFGVPRLRAGVATIGVEAATVGEALRALALALPALDGGVVVDGRPGAAYRASLNGERFVDDPATPLVEGDALIVLAADVGG